MTESPCGTCTMCCKLMAVPELEKPACKWCPRADPLRGCTAYEDRPTACREFECVWLQSQKRAHGEAAMSPAMRPDRSKVVINVRPDASGLVFHVDPGKPHAYREGEVSRLIDRLLHRGQEVIVVIGERRRRISMEKREPTAGERRRGGA